MNLKILGIFVKNYRETSDPRVRESCASIAGIVGIASNLLLSVLKLVIGVIASSISIMADAVNNLTDAGSSIITLIGFKLSSRPADAEHPYGHKRIEYITGLIVSMVITILGVSFLRDSIESIFEESTTVYTPTALVILAISIVVKLWQSRFYTVVGRHIDSTALIATASDSRNDVISTAAVLVGALISMLFKVDLDAYLGIAVALFIVKSGISLVIETSQPLLGLAPSPELIKSVGDKILSYEGILGYHDLVVHNYGPDHCFASVHAEVPAEQDILISHDIIDNIEFDFLRESGMHVVIHLDPVVTKDPLVNELHSEVADIVGGLMLELKCELSMHDFRVVKGTTHTNLVFDVVAPFGLSITDAALTELIGARIREKRPECNSVVTVDRSYADANSAEE